MDRIKEPRVRMEPDLQAQFREESVEWAGKWGNLLFSKNGTAYLGLSTYPTKQEAKARQLEYESVSASAYLTRDGLLAVADYSHTIQIPVKS